MEVAGIPDSLSDPIVDKMPSVKSLATFTLSLLGSAQSVLGLRNSVLQDLSFRSASASSCANSPTSCRNSSAVQDLCCFNAPGGLLLQTQFWDTNPQTGPVNSWTIHGLWPDNCDGTYEANCDDSRAYTNITQILQAAGKSDLVSYMHTYWPDYQGNDESFWEHEFGKHATCISTLDPSCYDSYQPTEEVPDFFQKVVDLYKTLPTYDWLKAAGIVPSSSATYTLSAIQAALSKNRNGYKPYLGCQSGALNEVWYFYNVQGSAQSGNYIATDVVGKTGTCPSSGIKYLPKTGGATPTSTSTTTSSGPSPTSTGGFSGSGFLNVVTSGSQQGCIISGGTWYTTGTCATITATSSGSGFTLKSSKGNCGIVSGALSCGSSVSATVFSAQGSNLVYNGQSTFYANGVPSGSTQATVYTDSGHSTTLTIQWSSK